jgi:hypothetical protein
MNNNKFVPRLLPSTAKFDSSTAIPNHQVQLTAAGHPRMPFISF